MFPRTAAVMLAAEDWRKIKLEEAHKLFKLHQFLFMSGGRSYNIEIQESQTGSYLAHADNNSDPHDAIKSVTGKSFEDCLKAMMKQLGERDE